MPCALAQSVVDAGVDSLASPRAAPTQAQVLAYDVAHAAAAVRTAEAVLAYGAARRDRGPHRLRLRGRRPGRPGHPHHRARAASGAWPRLDGAGRAVRGHLPGPGRSWPRWPTNPGPATSTPTSSWCGRPSTGSPRSRSGPGPSTSTGPTPTSPRRSSPGMAEMGGFGMSVPEEYGGFATGGEADYMGMVVATEELSWGSLGAGGSLITRPEILTRALVHGGTEEQKQRWLPKLATAEVMGAVAVTEPDFGSDVAGVVTSAVPDRGRLAHQRGQDVVHLRGPGRRAHAAGPDRSRPVQGPPGPVAVPGGEAPGRGARLPLRPGAGGRRPTGRRAAGRMEGRAIDTLGYRGMHSYEVAFESWFVPDANLVGGEDGLGPGLLPADAGVRERAAADGGPGHRGHAGRLRGRPRATPATGWCSGRRSSTTS